MFKKTTGVKYTPQEFRKLNQCLTCGKADSYIEVESQCNECQAKGFKKCKYCEIVLKEGVMIRYTYDIKEFRVDEEKRFKAKEQMIAEFSYESLPISEKFSEDECEDCALSGEGMKNICFWCDEDFKNNLEYYKLNGNTCEKCLTKFQEDEINERQNYGNQKEI